MSDNIFYNPSIKCIAGIKPSIPKIKFTKDDTKSCVITFEMYSTPTEVMTGITYATVSIKTATKDYTFGDSLVVVKDNLIEFTLPLEALELGSNIGECHVYGAGSKRLTMCDFKYTVQDTLIDGEYVPSSDRMPVLNDLINSVSNVASNETTRQSNETIRKSNEDTRQTNEAKRIAEYESWKGAAIAEDKVVYFQNEINKTNSSLDKKATPQDIADAISSITTFPQESLVFRDVVEGEIFTVSGGTTSTPSTLIHKWDFTQNSSNTVIDTIGSLNVDISTFNKNENGVYGNGENYLTIKDACGVDKDCTAFITFKKNDVWYGGAYSKTLTYGLFSIYNITPTITGDKISSNASIYLKNTNFYTLCITRNISTNKIRIYVDGVIIKEEDYAENWNKGDILLGFGGSKKGQHVFNNCEIYNSLLSDSDIAKTSEKLKKQSYDYTNSSVTITDKLMCDCDFTTITSNDDVIFSKVGGGCFLLKDKANIVFDNGIILSTVSGNPNLETHFNMPFTNKNGVSYVIKFTHNTSATERSLTGICNVSCMTKNNKIYIKSGTTVSSEYSLQNATDYTAVVTISNDICKLYINGVFVSSISVPTVELPVNDVYYWVLKNESKFKKVLLYDKTLSDSEVSIIHSDLNVSYYSASTFSINTRSASTENSIKVIQDTYPVTVMEAVYVSGTNKNLKEFLSEANSSDIEWANKVTLLKRQTQNLFDKTKAVDNAYYNSNGSVHDVNQMHSSFIEVKPNTRYTKSHSGITSILNSNKIEVAGGNNSYFTTTSDAKYVVVSFSKHTANKDVYMLVEGSVLPSEYQEYNPSDLYNLPKESFQVTLRDNIVDYSSLTVECRDSIKKYIEFDSMTDEERFKRARGKVRLQVETYYEGGNQPIHPKILKITDKNDVTKGWNGWLYWMCYSPYPYEDIKEENPCIAVSNDLIYWTTPSGLTNPLDTPDDVSGSCWADPCLVYNNDLDQLELWYRGGPIARKITTDGVNWSERTIIKTFEGGGYACPTIIYENGTYTIWCSATNGGVYTTSGECTEWTRIGDLPNWWHFDIIRNPNTNLYEAIYTDNSGLKGEHFYCISKDGLKWQQSKVLQKCGTTGIDDGGYYKPTFIYDNGHYVVIYTVKQNTKDGKWWSLSMAKTTLKDNIFSIKGIESYDNVNAKPFTRKPRYGLFVGENVFDLSLGKVVYCKQNGKSTIWVDAMGTVIQ